MGLSRKTIAMLAVLISGTFITILNQTLVNPALPSIMTELNVTASTVQWLTTGFTMVNAVMVPVTAYMTDRFKTKGLFIVSMLLFSAGTALCAVSPNFALLLVGRLIQAAGAGVLMPMVATVMLLTFPREKRGFAMGLFGIVIMFAPALGPTIAGLIIDHFGWKMMFIVVVTLSLLDVIISIFVLEKEDKVVPDNLHLDKLSVVLSTLGFGGLLYGFSTIGNYGISIGAAAGVVIGAVCLVIFILRQLKLDVPMLEMRVLKNRRFAVGTVIGMIIQASIMANAVLIPVFCQSLAGQSATTSGLVLMPGAILMGIMGPVSGKLFDKYGPRGLAIIGTLMLAIGTVFMCMLTANTSMLALGIIVAIRNVAMSLVNMPLNTWSMNALDNRYINHGNAVNNTFRQVAGSLGAAIVISVYSLVSDAGEPTMGYIASHIMGVNAAFGVQLVLVVIALILTIAMVKSKAGDLIGNDTDDHNKSILENLMERDIFTVSTKATVGEVVALLLEKQVSGFPVLDENNRVYGFVSDGDIIRALSSRVTTVVDPIASIFSSKDIDEDSLDVVNELMASPVTDIAVHGCQCANIHMNINEVMKIMGSQHLKKMPVVENGVVVGIINRSDITRAALAAYSNNR